LALEDVASCYQLCTFWLRYPGPIAIGPTLFYRNLHSNLWSLRHPVRKNLDRSAALWIGV